MDIGFGFSYRWFTGFG